MTCNLCDTNISVSVSNIILCGDCEQYDRSQLFPRILLILQDIKSNNRGYDVFKDKCKEIDLIIKRYPINITSFCIFNPDDHDVDRTALEYIRNYVGTDGNNLLQNYRPVKPAALDNDNFYKTIAMLCQLNFENGSKELRVRNIVDMALNADSYCFADTGLDLSFERDDTWKDFLLKLIYEDLSINGFNTFFVIVLSSLSNIINANIRSIYPNVPGHNSDLRRRFDRIFSPLNRHLPLDTMRTINILWSNTKYVSHSTNEIWVSDCVVPLVLKSDVYIINPINSTTIAQNPPAPERNFYKLSCLCSLSQNGLDAIISVADQQKCIEAKNRGEIFKLSNIFCPKCSKSVNDYWYDSNAVTLFRQNFTGARLTYILVDDTASMQSKFLFGIKNGKRSCPSRIDQTKVAIKQLLREIAADAGRLDLAILALFDEKLRDPALIPLGKATDIAKESNLIRIDKIELCSRSVKTSFYSVLKQVYEMLAQQPYLYIDLYVFSDGNDTSDNKTNEKTHQAVIRYLNERIGAKCHFMNVGSTLEGDLVANWLGDPEANCPISGEIEEIEAQIKASHRKDHAINPNLRPRNHDHINSLNYNSPSSSTTYLTHAETTSIHIPPRRNSVFPTSTEQNSNENRMTIDDYAHSFPSATQRTYSRQTSNISGEYRAVTRFSRPR